jgi:hypothetical protein
VSCWLVEWEDGGRSGEAAFASGRSARLAAAAFLAVLSPACGVRVWRGLELVEEWHWESDRPACACAGKKLEVTA